MAIQDKIKIDFAVIETGDPKYLIIQDLSSWGAIEQKKSIIEVKTPGREQLVTYNYNKGSYNNFNSSILYLSSVGVYNDLPDGLYEITVKGSPSTDFCETKMYLKTDKVKAILADYYFEVYLENRTLDDPQLKKLRELKDNIELAKNAVRIGENALGNNLLKGVYSKLKKYKECKNC